MARAVLLGLVLATISLVTAGCKASGDRGAVRGRAWLDAEGDWSARVADDRVQVRVKVDQAGLFGRELSITADGAHVQVGPLAAQTYDGEPLKFQPAKMERPLSMQRGSLEVWQGMQDQRQVRTKVIPGEVTVIEVTGADQLARLTLPIKIDGVDLLAMDYGWVMRSPGRFSRNRVMTNFVLA
jgi:hypothetical protein